MAELNEKLRCETESSSKSKKSIAELQQVRSEIIVCVTSVYYL